MNIYVSSEMKLGSIVAQKVWKASARHTQLKLFLITIRSEWHALKYQLDL